MGGRHRVVPDRIEAATYLIAAGVTQGSVKVTGAVPEHLGVVLRDLKKAGLEVRQEFPSDPRRVQWVSCAFKKSIRPVSVSTEPYPGFPTDVQAQWMALMALSKGRSTIKESIFENRFLHAAELLRMGARVQIQEQRAVVTGVSGLSGADVMVSDLRAGAAMVLAGLAAKGRTGIHRIYHLDRGYEHLERKFRKLGARIKRMKE
jgi:UDP-N-acetylglucosamine 1-carboxyvinyltransferase